MTSPSSPFDIRSQSFRSYFEKALPYDAYVATGTPAQQEKWAHYEKSIALPDSALPILKQFTRTMPVLCMSGVWCGDCMRQGPMLRAIEKAAPVISLRFIDNQENPELRDELRIAGGSRVPVALMLSEDFFEVARFGDRTLGAYRRKAANELGPACDSGLGGLSPAELAEETLEWVSIFERAQLLLRLSPFLRNRHGD